MQNGDFSGHEHGACPDECQAYHQMLYLEHCLRTAAAPAALHDFLASSSSRVRRLAQLVAEQQGIAVRSMLNDPCSTIREAYLRKTECLDDLLRSINDENRFMRVRILRRIQAIAIPPERRMEVLQALAEYINDKDYPVRLEFARTLRVFRGLRPDFIAQLFDKKDLGLFIYGAEDEFYDVRETLVRSINTFVTPETIALIFDYLIDMLNDESDAVRRAVVHMLKRLSRRHALAVDDSQLSFILDSLEECDSCIKEGILGLIAHLRYRSIAVYFQLLKQQSIADAVVLRCLRQLVQHNHQLFHDSLPYIYKHSELIDESDAYDLYERGYLACLVVLSILRRHYDSPVSKRVRKDFQFLRLKLYNRRPRVDYTRAMAMREKAIRFAEGKEEHGGEVEVDENAAQSYFHGLFQALKEYRSEGKKDGLFRFSYQFKIDKARERGAHARISKGICSGYGDPGDGLINKAINRRCRERTSKIDIPEITPERILSDSFSMDLIHENLRFLEPSIFDRILFSEFIVNVPESIVLIKNMPVEFQAFLFFGYTADSIVFIVEDSSSQAKIVYGLEERVRVVIDDCRSDLICYIAACAGDGLCKLSSEARISIREDLPTHL